MGYNRLGLFCEMEHMPYINSRVLIRKAASKQ